MAVEGEAEKTFDMFEEEGTDMPACKSTGGSDGDDINSKMILEMLEITIADPEKRTAAKSSLKMQDTYIAYLVETKPKDIKDIDQDLKEVSSVWRRYSEFELLRNYLVVTYPTIVMPPLPEKHTSFVWTKIATDTFDPEFLERRRMGLESFLHRICRHASTSSDEIILKFLKQEEGWRETVMMTGYQTKADSWLKTLNASWRVKQPDQGFEELKIYAADLHTNLANVLKARAKLADRVYGLYKIHANYSRIFKEWSAVEDSKMCDSLRKASLEIDRLSLSIDSLMDEEELYAEQLKEYFYFTESLKTIVKKHEALQYDLEQVDNQVMNARAEKKQLMSGVGKNFSLVGMKAKFFGVDTSEQKDLKVAKLSELIQKLEESAETKMTAAKSFMAETEEEIKKFKSQKQTDLRDILTSYVILQIKMAKENRATWSRFRGIMQSA